MEAHWQIFWEPVEYDDLVRYYEQQIEGEESDKKRWKREMTSWNSRYILETLLEAADKSIKYWLRKLRKLENAPLHAYAWYVLHPNDSPPKKRNIKKGYLPVQDIEKAKAVPIADLYQNPLRGHGRILSGRCPFHNERTPSFKIYTDKNSFWCYGCSQGGTAVDYIMIRDDVDFLEAVKTLL